MTLKDIRDLYLTITPNVYHQDATGAEGNYIVWAEDGQGDDIHADNKKIGRALQGTTDYYTKDEFDPMVNEIEKAMNNSEMSWRLNSIQYEEDTKYTHYEWVWEVDEWLE